MRPDTGLLGGIIVMLIVAIALGFLALATSLGNCTDITYDPNTGEVIAPRVCTLEGAWGG